MILDFFNIFCPSVIIYFSKLFLDSLPGMINSEHYIAPITAFMMHFFEFILCSIVLVQERTAAILQQMFFSGYRKIHIIGGYSIGYMCIRTIKALLVLWEITSLFSLNYSFTTLLSFFLTIWLLIFVSVMLGILLSTFARTEAQVFPFIPLLHLPSIFSQVF